MREAWARLAALAPSLPEGPPLARRQRRWLDGLLEREQHTAFGGAHGFARIKDPEAYREAVPARSYEGFSPWLSRITEGEPDQLFRGLPVAFERTGGSAGGTKLIPYSREGLADFRKALRPWLAGAIRRHGLEEGTGYWVTSPALRAVQEILPGVPLGLSDAVYLGEDAIEDLARVSALPPWVAELGEVGPWRLATLHALVVHEDLAFISLWSPTFLTDLLDHLLEEDPVLDCLLGEGGTLAGQGLGAESAAFHRLQQFRQTGSTGVLWPRLRMLSAWADGASEPYARELQRRIPHAVFEAKGLLSTEGVVSVPGAGGAAVLAADSGFFEFMVEDGTPRFAWELAAGMRAEVILTTASGLYRYRTGDRIECTGFEGDTPRLRFLGRAGLVSDLVGEKLDEAFVAECLRDVAGFRMLLPAQAPARRYLLVVDRAEVPPTQGQLEMLETRLRANPQYAHARQFGQLEAVAVMAAEKPLATYLAHQTAQGQRPGTLKIPALRPEPGWAMIFLQETP